MDAPLPSPPDLAGCRACPDLFTLNGFQEVVFCHGARGRFIDDYRNRDEAYREFLRAGARPAGRAACPRRQPAPAAATADEEFPESAPADLAAFVTRLGPRRAARFRPARIFCFPTLACNNACCFCRSRNAIRPGLSDRDALLELIDRHAAAFPALSIGGGEPTLYPHLRELLARARQRGLFTHLFSNARRLADPAFTAALLAAGIDRITVTLHSHDAAAHDRFTRRPGSWQETVAGLQQLRRAGFRNLTVMIIISRANCDHLAKLLRFALSFAPRHVNLNALVLLGDALANASELALPLARTAPALEAAMDLLRARGVSFSFASHPLCLVRPSYWRFAVNVRYALEVRTLPGIGRGYVKNGGTILAPRCIDCGLKRFCPGTWYASWACLGDGDLRPQPLTTSHLLHLPPADIFRLLVDAVSCGLTRHRPLPNWLRFFERRFCRMWTKIRDYA